jgi:hypothetical protein
MLRRSLRDHHYGWHRRARPFRATGEHRAADHDNRPYLGPTAAILGTILVVGSYFAVPLLRPNGQLLPQRPLPGIEQQVPTIGESPIERLQASDEPQTASRGHPRQTPAPALSQGPGPAAAADRASSPAAAATSTPDGGTKAQGPLVMPSTACPPPLPPPAKAKKPKKGPPEEPPGQAVAKLFILKPAAIPPGRR